MQKCSEADEGGKEPEGPDQQFKGTALSFIDTLIRAITFLKAEFATK